MFTFQSPPREQIPVDLGSDRWSLRFDLCCVSCIEWRKVQANWLFGMERPLSPMGMTRGKEKKQMWYDRERNDEQKTKVNRRANFRSLTRFNSDQQKLWPFLDGCEKRCVRTSTGRKYNVRSGTRAIQIYDLSSYEKMIHISSIPS
jgi:hypothetical protein